MRLYSVNGKLTNKNVTHQEIDWEGKSRSTLQRKVKDLLFPFWKNHIVYEEFPVYGTRYSLDFYNATRNIAIEVQGKQHTQYVPFFHNSNRFTFVHQLYKDDKKRFFCEKNDIYLIEIFEEEKKKLSPEFIKRLLDEAK